MPKLQIAIQADVIGDDKPEINVTPVDIPISEDAANALLIALKVADDFDDEPGDGEFTKAFKSKVPVRVNVLGKSLGADINVDGKAVVRIAK